MTHSSLLRQSLKAWWWSSGNGNSNGKEMRMYSCCLMMGGCFRQPLMVMLMMGYQQLGRSVDSQFHSQEFVAAEQDRIISFVFVFFFSFLRGSKLLPEVGLGSPFVGCCMSAEFLPNVYMLLIFIFIFQKMYINRITYSMPTCFIPSNSKKKRNQSKREELRKTWN